MKFDLITAIVFFSSSPNCCIREIKRSRPLREIGSDAHTVAILRLRNGYHVARYHGTHRHCVECNYSSGALQSYDSLQFDQCERFI